MNSQINRRKTFIRHLRAILRRLIGLIRQVCMIIDAEMALSRGDQVVNGIVLVMGPEPRLPLINSSSKMGFRRQNVFISSFRKQGRDTRNKSDNNCKIKHKTTHYTLMMHVQPAATFEQHRKTWKTSSTEKRQRPILLESIVPAGLGFSERI